MKWTTDRLACALFMKDWKVDYAVIAKELGCTVKAVERKIGINYKAGRARLVTDSVEDQARRELRRALSNGSSLSKPNVGVWTRPRVQNRRLQVVDRSGEQRTQPTISRINRRAVQAGNPTAGRAAHRPG
jgi:hypothetical protein